MHNNKAPTLSAHRINGPNAFPLHSITPNEAPYFSHTDFRSSQSRPQQRVWTRDGTGR